MPDRIGLSIPPAPADSRSSTDDRPSPQDVVGARYRPEPKQPQAEQDDIGQAKSWLARAGLFLLSIVLLRLAFELWWVGQIHVYIWIQVAVALMYLAGGAFLFLALVDIRHERFDKIGFGVLTSALGVFALAHIRVFAVRYTSDAMLFVHEAAAQLLMGNNPYQIDLVGGYEAFAVPFYVQTPTTSGGLVTNLNYPALAFLVYAPFVAAGLGDLRPVSAAFLLGVLGLVYLGTPRHLRLLAMSILFLSSFFLSFALSGFDIVFIFFLVGTVVLWKRFPVAAMVMFGLSCAVKQQPWFLAPFVAIRLWKESLWIDDVKERLTHVGRLIGYAAATFLVPNLLFILWDPAAWLVGIFTPLGATGEALTPLAQGLFIFYYTGTVRIDPILVPLVALSVLIGLVALYWVFYDRMREAMWVAPSLILMFNQRALQNYYEMFYPVGLAGLLATIPASWEDVPPDYGEPPRDPDDAQSGSTDNESRFGPPGTSQDLEDDPGGPGLA